MVACTILRNKYPYLIPHLLRHLIKSWHMHHPVLLQLQHYDVYTCANKHYIRDVILKIQFVSAILKGQSNSHPPRNRLYTSLLQHTSPHTHSHYSLHYGHDKYSVSYLDISQHNPRISSEYHRCCNPPPI